jgi:hypothetical protein
MQKKHREISLALRSWRLPGQTPIIIPPKPNSGHFSTGDPRTVRMARMGARVSPWRFGIHYSKPEWLK